MRPVCGVAYAPTPKAYQFTSEQGVVISSAIDRNDTSANNDAGASDRSASRTKPG